MVVNQSAGEVRARRLHADPRLAVRADFAAQKPELVAALVRAVARAEKLIHTDQSAPPSTPSASALPRLDRKHVEALVDVYEPAVPATPEVSAEALHAALALFPANKVPPKLDGIDLRSTCCRASRTTPLIAAHVALIGMSVPMGQTAAEKVPLNSPICTPVSKVMSKVPSTVLLLVSTAAVVVKLPDVAWL